MSTCLLIVVPVYQSVQGVAVAESGCILEVLDNFTREKGYCVPLDLGAKGSCQIGGNVATHAGANYTAVANSPRVCTLDTIIAIFHIAGSLWSPSSVQLFFSAHTVV